MNLLIEQGSATKNELESMLREELGMKTVDINPLISPMVKSGLLSSEWVEGLPSECVFLVRDAFIARTPPQNIINLAKNGGLPADVAQTYLSRITSYFEKYDPADGDINVVSNVLVEPDMYDALTILRNAPANRAEIKEKTKMSTDNVAKALERLERTEFIIRLRDETGVEYLLLKTDPKIITFFPEHCITTAITRYNERMIPPRQAIHHLALLREKYPKGQQG